jgi:hypothetical protein
MMPPIAPSSVRLFHAIRQVILMKKLRDDQIPLGRRQHVCTNNALFQHFHPDDKVESNDFMYAGQHRWCYAARHNLNRLIEVDLVTPASVLILPENSPMHQMGDDWYLTQEAVELIQLLKQDSAIDEAVSARVRSRAMEEQEPM